MSNSASAAPLLNWDPNASGTSTGSGGGTWNTASWWNGTNDVGWVTGDDAAFGGAAGGTVSLSGTVSAADLIFNTTGYTVSSTTGTNTLTLTGGSVNVAAAAATISSALVGSVTLTKTGTGNLTLGSASTGYTGNYLISAGTLTANAQGSGLGQNSGTRTVTVNTGGTLLMTNNNVFGGGGLTAGGLPTIVLNGGLLTSTRYNAIGNVNLSGGTLNQNATDGTGTYSYQGYDLLGTITVSGTAASYITNLNITGNNTLGAHDHLYSGGNTFNVGSTGAVGGDLIISAGLMNGSGDYTGTGSIIKTGLGNMVLASSINSYTGTTSVNAGTLTLTGTLAGGGAIIVGSAGTFSESSSGFISGAAVLTSGGTTTLSGSNSYTGATNIATGTLFLSGSGSIASSPAINIAPGAVLDVSGLTSAFTLGAAQSLNVGRGGTAAADINGSLASSGTINNRGTLTINGSLSLNNGGNLVLSTGNLVSITGGGSALTLTGTTTVLPGYLANGTYPFISGYSSLAGTGSLSLASLANYRGAPAGSLSVGPTAVTATISGLTPGTLTWAPGVGSNTWDVNTTSNWLNNSSGTADKFYQADAVTFNDTAGTTTVNIPANVYPASVTVSTSGTYTLAGAGAIGGPATLTKTGSGTLIVSGTNTYTGATTVSGGTLSLTGALNSAALALGGGGFNYSAPSGSIQSFAITTVGSGASSVSNTVAGDTLNLGALTQAAGSGAAVKLSLTGSITTTTTDSNGMIGGWAIIDNGNSTYSWAHSGTAGTNPITAAATTATLSTTANWTGGTTLTANSTVNSVIESADINLGGHTLTVSSGGVILQGANFWMQGGGTLTTGLASGELFVHSANATLTDEQIYVNIANNGSIPLILVKDGPGTTYITGGANTYTGGTIINGGILSDVGSHTGSGLGSTSGPLTINNGAFNFAEAGDTAISVGVGSLNGNVGTLIENLGSGTPTFTVGNNNTSGTYAGAITNSIALTKTGTGMLLLSGSNSYTGATTVSGGTLALGYGGVANGTIGSSAITINAGVTLLTTTADVTGSGSTAALTISGGTLLKGPGNFHESLGRPITLAGGTIATSDTGSSAFGDYYNLDGLTISTSANSGISSILAAPGGGGQILLRANGVYPTFYVATGSTLAVSANLGRGDTIDNLNINGSGVGLVVLSGTNTYGGVTNINGGLLQFATSAAFPSGGTVNINAGGLLASGPYNSVSAWLGNSVISGTSAGYLALTATGTDAEPLNMTGYANLSLGTTGSVTLTGLYTQGGTACNLGGGGGTLTFTPAIPGGSALVLQPGTVVLTNTANGTLASLASMGTGTFNLVVATAASGTPLTLTVGGNNASTTFAGAISDQSAVNPAAAASLVKTGTGSLTISGASTYAGTTTINQGMLALGYAANNGFGALAPTSTVTVNSSGTLQTYSTNALGQGNLLVPLVVNGGGLLTISNSATNNLGALTLGGGTLGSISNSAQWGSWTLTSPVSVTANSTISAASVFPGNAAICLGQGAFNIASGVTLQVPGTFTNQNSGAYAGILVQTGSGTMVLGGSNTYTGGTVVSGGTLQAGSGNASALGSNASLSVAGGALVDLNGNSESIGGLNGAGTVNNIAGGGSITLSVGGGGAGGSFSGTLANTSGTTALVKTGAGLQVLSGVNSYTGGTTISGGELSISSAANLGGAAAALAISGGTLQVTGTSLTGMGSLGLSASSFNGGFDIANPANTFAVANALSGTGSLTKIGAGTLSLSGTNTYSGTTSVNAGILNLDFTAAGAPASNILSSAGTLALRGGTLAVIGNSSALGSQQFSNVVLNPAASAISLATAQFGTLALGAITRNVGGTVDFGVLPASGSITTSTSNANFSGGQATILGGYATVGGSSWAVAGTGAAPYTLSALPSGSYGTFSTAGADVDTTGATAPGTMTINSLRFSQPGTATVTESGTLTVATGGILETSGVGANNVAISGGSLTSGNGTDLIVIQNNSAAQLAINSLLTGTGGLTTTGPGLVVLTASNTYTGTTNVTGGTLQVGTSSGAAATLSPTGAITVTSPGTLMYSTSLNGLVVANNFSGNGTLLLANPVVSSSATYNLTGTNSSFTGTVDVANNARYTAAAAANLPASSGNIVVANGGGLFVSGAFTATTPLSLAGIGWTESAGNLGALRLDAGASIWAGPITLAANARIGEYSNSGASITGNISGPYQLELWAGNGNKSITLSGSNTYASTLIDGSMNAIGAGSTAFSTGGMNVSAGTLSLNGFNYSFANLSGAGVIQNDVGVLPSILTVGSDNTNTAYTGTLINGGAAALALVKTGTGYLALTGANTYSGGTTINGGDIRLGNNANENANSLGTGLVTITGGGRLHGWPGSTGTTYNIPNNITINNGSFWGEDGVQRLKGTVTIGSGGAQFYSSWGGKDTYIDGPLAGSGPLTVDAINQGGGYGGTVHLTSSASAYTGTLTVNPNGYLSVENNTPLQNATVIDNGTAAGRGLAFTSAAPIIGSLSGNGLVSVAAGTNLSIDALNTNTTYSGIMSGAGGLTKIGTAALVLTAYNTYTGGTTVSGGTLVINPSLLNTGASLIGSGTLTINPGATVETYVNSFGSNAPFLPVVINGGLLNQLYTGSVGPDSHIGAITMTGGTISGTEFDPQSGVTTLASSATAIISAGTLSLQAANTFNVAGFGSGSPDLSVSSNIVGPYSIAKQGGGWMLLSGANAYSGGTSLSGGTLQLGSASALGSSTANLSVNSGLLDLHGYNAGAAAFSGSGTVDNLAASSTSTLTVGSGNATTTYSGTILSSAGGISLVKTGTGALALTGNNLYTGTTAVNGGLLVVTGSHTGGGAYTISGGTLGGFATISAPVTLNAGSGLAPGAAGVGTMSLGGLSLAGSNDNVLFDLTGNPLAGNDEVAVAGALSLAGTTTISVNRLSTALASGNYPLFTYTSLSGNPATQLSLAAPSSVLTSRQNYSFIASEGVVSLSISGAAQTLTWNGSGSNTWDNGTSNSTWINNASAADIFVLGDNVIFSNSGSQTNVNVNAAVAPNTVLVTGSNNYTLSGSGSISGPTTPLTMQGSGVLTLATTGNTYGGGTLLQSGTLALGAANALPIAGSVSMGTAGATGTLDLAGFNQQIAALAVGSGATAAGQVIGNSSTANNATLTLSGGTSTFGGAIQNTLGGGNKQVALAVTSSASLTLTGPNTYSGATTINNGSSLQIGNGGSGELLASASIADNGAVVFNHADALTYAGAISGSGTLGKQGPGLLLLSAASTFSGGATINGGTLQLGAADSLQNSTVSANVNGMLAFSAGLGQFNLGGLAGNGQVTLADVSGNGVGLSVGLNGQNSTFSGSLLGSGSFTKTGEGGLTLTGSNTYTGITIVTGSAAAPATSSTGSLVIGAGSGYAINGDLQLGISGGTNNSRGYVYLAASNRINPASNLTLLGAACADTIDLQGNAQTFASISNSDVFARIENSWNSTAYNGTTGTLTINNASTNTFSGILANSSGTAVGGSLALVKSNSGLLLLTGAGNSYTGGTTISAGTLQIGDGATSSGSITGNILNNTSLVFATPGVLAYGSVISGPGSLTKAGSGTLTLSGFNTYSGGTTVNSGTLAIAGGGNGSGVVIDTLSINPGAEVNITSHDVFGYSNTASSLVTLNINGGILNEAYAGNETVTGVTINMTAGTVSASGAGAYYDMFTAAGYGNTGFNILASASPSVISAELNFRVESPVFTVATGSTTSGVDLLVSGKLMGGYGFTKAGPGVMQITNSNTYTGTATVGAGTLQAGNNGALGAGSAGLTVAGGAVLDLYGFNSSVGAFNGSGIVDLSTSGVSTLTVGGGGASGTFSGTIQNSTGAVALVKTGGGTQVLSGTNSYTGGTSLAGGTLNFTPGAVPLAANSITFNGGTLQWAAGNTQDVSSAVVSLAAGQVASIDTNGNAVNFASGLSGSGGLTKVGAGTLSLTASDAFSGPTTISGGTLNVAHALALQNSTVTVAANNSLAFSVPSATLGGLAGSASVNLGNTALTIGANGVNTTYSGVLTGGSGLTKTGGGVTTLLNIQSYAGPTTISAGTLQLTGQTDVGIKFATSRTAGTVYNVTGSAGAVAMSNWNNLTGNSQATAQVLHDNNNLTNGPAVTWSNPGGAYDVFNASQTDQNAQLLNSYLDNTSGGGSQLINVTGIPYGLYDVYVYFASDGNNRKGQVSIGGTTYYYQTAASNVTRPYPLTQTTDTAATYPAANYAEFQGLSGSSFTINQVELVNNGIAAVEVVGRGLLNQLPAATALSVASGATLDLAGASQQVISLSDSLPGAGGTIINSNAISPSVLTLGTTGSSTFSGSIQNGNGSISLVMNGTGTQLLSGSNTFSGGTTVSSGLLQLGSSSALGTGNLAANAGTVDLAGNSITVTAFSGAASTITNSGGSLATLTTTQNGTTTFSGTLQDGASPTGLAMTGTGTLVLANSNTFSGTVHVGNNSDVGQILLANSLALQNANLNDGNDNGIAFAANISSATLGSIGSVSRATQDLTLSNAASGAVTLVVGNNGNNGTYSGRFLGNGGIDKIGAGSLTLLGKSSNSGANTLEVGTLVMGNHSALGAGTLTLNGGTLAGSVSGGTIAGLVQGGSGPQTIAPGAGLSSGQYGILNLNGGLDTNSSTTLAYNLNLSSSIGGSLNSEPIYAGDLINLGAGGVTGSGSISIAGLGTAPADYRLFGGSVGASYGSLVLPTLAGDTVSLSTAVDSGYLDLVVATGAAFSGSATWNGANGSWNTSANWFDGSNQNGVPGTSLSRTADTATFSGSGAVTAITLDASPSLAALSFSGANYTLTGSSLTLHNGSGTATVLVTSSTQTIASGLVLASSGSFQPDAASVLNLSGSISGGGALSLDGSGELVLSNSSNNYTGGTYVNSGTLVATVDGAIPDGSSLTVGAGASSLFASSVLPGVVAGSPREVVAVPEPGTVALLLAALWSAVIYYRFRRPKAFGVR